MKITRARIADSPDWTLPVVEAEVDGVWRLVLPEPKESLLDDDVVVLEWPVAWRREDVPAVLTDDSDGNPVVVSGAVRHVGLAAVVRRQAGLTDEDRLPPGGPPIDLPEET